MMKQNRRKRMSTHQKNLALMTVMFTTLVTLNFFAVITGNADVIYEPLTEWLKPIMLGH